MTGKIRTKKNKCLKLRVSDEELTLLREKAALSGCTISDYIRAALRRTRTWTITDKEIVKEQIRQIVRIGTNVNQISRWANTYKSHADAMQIVSHLIVIERKLRTLLSDTHKKES